MISEIRLCSIACQYENSILNGLIGLSDEKFLWGLFKVSTIIVAKAFLTDKT
jgi:hypothetical protein